MSENLPEVRIGEAERDDAVSLLQEHLRLGRLQHDEFDDRIARALAAQTRGELELLFADLPGRRPGQPDPEAAPAPAGRPWYAQWWMFVLAIFVAGLTRGRLGWLVPVMAVWLWVVWPMVARRVGGAGESHTSHRQLDR